MKAAMINDKRLTGRWSDHNGHTDGYRRSNHGGQPDTL
jgi:hypothetical protein